MRRLLLPFLFVSCGFFGGMVLTGRLRTAEEARAEPRPASAPQAAAASAPAWPRSPISRPSPRGRFRA